MYFSFKAANAICPERRDDLPTYDLVAERQDNCSFVIIGNMEEANLVSKQLAMELPWNQAAGMNSVTFTFIRSGEFKYLLAFLGVL